MWIMKARNSTTMHMIHYDMLILYMGQSIQEQTKKNLGKIAFKKFCLVHS